MQRKKRGGPGYHFKTVDRYTVITSRCKEANGGEQWGRERREQATDVGKEGGSKGARQGFESALPTG